MHDKGSVVQVKNENMEFEDTSLIEDELSTNDISSAVKELQANYYQTIGHCFHNHRKSKAEILGTKVTLFIRNLFNNIKQFYLNNALSLGK